jgi:hypothetical protein
MLICRSGGGAEGVHIGSPHSKIQHLLGKKRGGKKKKGGVGFEQPKKLNRKG